MFGRVPAYTDISHFRAPYKNAYIAGYGQDAPPAPPPPPSGGPTEAQFVTTDERGYRFINKEVLPLVMTALSQYGTVFLGGEFNQVKIQPFTPEMIAASKNPQAKAILDTTNAKAWAEQQASDGKVVFMSMATLVGVMSGQPLSDGANRLGTWDANTANAKEAAKSPMGVVLAGDPDGKLGGIMTAGIAGPLGIAVAVALAVGGVYYFSTRKGRGAAMSSF